MALLGIDIGTTHTKVGLFNNEGTEIQIAVRPTESFIDQEGHPFISPDQLWTQVRACIKEITTDCKEKIDVIGIASMAETGLLVDRGSGQTKTAIIPWYSRCGESELHKIAAMDTPLSRFQKTGLHNSYKYGLAKILWLQRKQPELLKNAVWLSAADFIAYKLSGNMATDYSLAARTFTFRIDTKTFDDLWIKSFGLPKDLFPPAYPSGTKIGEVSLEVSQPLGLLEGIPVAIAGHDHVCAALAVGVHQPGRVFDSMGTAETLSGTFSEKPLGQSEFHSGLSYGCNVIKGQYFWMGGLPSSGGSVEWMRAQLAEPKMSYEYMQQLVSATKQGPTGILYYPYLSGSGAPQPDHHTKGAFVGLSSTHSRGELLKAVLEGTAYEIESIRRVAEESTGLSIKQLIAVGGGTRNASWLQIKADITQCELVIPQVTEATLLGAAIVAAIGCEIYQDLEAAMSKVHMIPRNIITPNQEHSMAYKVLYEEGYKFLQTSLRMFYNKQKSFH
ncbi:xylulokinase [Pullulanibacillus pueri]|uniref:Xylulokinase n=1 Tax=Pullulanibacillus pueri TaxID=1437324 RepID=A0A8J3ENK4_9BACL|nr:FGGY family carbohydrate kinase [Pullulanibacillus pueri]MBM7682917.1 xylulokinase [Pullulanibacillus pueri]GGH84794.1 xylulokinase [Pullulanibacillus pueri]